MATGLSTRHFLVFKGKRYDAKAILGAAYKAVAPNAKPLIASQFTGGDYTFAMTFKRHGFTIEKTGAFELEPGFERSPNL